MPGKREPPLRPKHDASYKSFFARRRTVVDTLRAFASDIAAHLDFATLERMSASFVTRALDQRHADMLWRVQTTGGGWLYILILLEFQSTVDHRWTAPTDVADMLPPAPDELLGYLPRHRYLLIEIQAEDPAALPPDNVLSMIARFE